MAETKRAYTSDGIQTTYPVDFTLGYIDTAHVYVFSSLVDSDYETELAYTYNNDNEIELDTAAPDGDPVIIRRVVPRDSLVNDFEDAAILKGNELDDSYMQLIHIFEEIADGYFSPLGTSVLQQDLDFGGYTGINVRTPTDRADLVDYGTFQDMLDVILDNPGAIDDILNGISAEEAARIAADAQLTIDYIAADGVVTAAYIAADVVQQVDIDANAAAIAVVASSVIAGLKTGMVVTNGAVNGLTDIDVTAGSRASADGTAGLTLASADIMELDNTTASTGHRPATVALAADTVYYVFICGEADGSNPVLRFDTDIAADNALTELGGPYTTYAYLMSIRTETGGTGIKQYQLAGNRIIWDVAEVVLDDESMSGKAAARQTIDTITVPNSLVNIRAVAAAGTGDQICHVLFTSEVQADIVPDRQNCHVFENDTSDISADTINSFEMMVNATEQVYYRASVSTGQCSLSVIITGYTDLTM